MAAATPTPSPISVRDLRRSDVPAWEPVLLQGIGRFEQVTGLDRGVENQLKILRGRGIWVLFNLLRSFQRAPLRILVGTDGPRIVGTATLLYFPQFGYVAGVATDARARGRGVATAVLAQLHAHAARRGRRWAVLDVEADNETAIRLYRKLGYRDLTDHVWFVGPLPAPPAVPGPSATEVRSPDPALVSWVDSLRPPDVRSALPATRGLLSHLEMITNAPRPQRRTWTLTSSGGVVGVVRGRYAPWTKTGYLFPYVPATADAATRRALLAAVFAAHAALGGERVVVTVPAPADEWDEVLRPLGVERAVVTRTMVRPLAP